MRTRFPLLFPLVLAGLLGAGHAPAAELRVGVIGLDTSHATAFTKLLNDPTDPNHVPGARVVAAFKGGSPDLPSSWSRVEEYTKEMTNRWGVVIHDTIESLCRDVDAVLLTSVDGRPHLAQARPVIAAGKPLYIDKPLATSVKDAARIFSLARLARVPVFSSSSLRFARATLDVRDGSIGKVQEAETFSPCHTDPTHPELFWYGIHGVESLYTVMGRGCETVTRTTTADGKVQVVGRWTGGRQGTFREGEGYGGTAKGERGTAPVGAFDGYAPMVREIVKFFRTGVAPVESAETLELIAFMEAAAESKEKGGVAVSVPEVLRRGRVAGFEANYDEARIAPYTLPDPLRRPGGGLAETARQWRREVRPVVLEQFREHVYGHRPGRPADQWFEVRSERDDAWEGKAIRREVRVWLGRGADAPWLDVLLYVPRGVRGQVPVFLGLDFEGNQAVTPEREVAITPHWVADAPARGRSGNRATEASRGAAASRWPIGAILERGYGLATVYYGDLEPDHPEGWKTGVRSRFAVGERPVRARTGVVPGPSDWGAIGAWAWGLSRAMDYLESDPRVDQRRVAVIGHSRLGKTALWAGAEDERFAMILSNNSGEGGAALARRDFGETTARLNDAFPHWFCLNFRQYNEAESRLPVDQHQLIALAAPRPLYVASASKDQWADPRGEFLAARAADPVYALFRRTGLGTDAWPAAGSGSVGDLLGYHLRAGEHDMTAEDWGHYLDFADRHLGRRGR